MTDEQIEIEAEKFCKENNITGLWHRELKLSFTTGAKWMRGKRNQLQELFDLAASRLELHEENQRLRAALEYVARKEDFSHKLAAVHLGECVTIATKALEKADEQR